MKNLSGVSLFLIMVGLTLGSSHSLRADAAPSVSLARLKAGNARFVSGRLTHPNLSSERRAELTGGQRPGAVIVALGDLFVVRVAGNVLNDQIVGSIEYAVVNLGTRLIIVLGHEGCGAVTSARSTLSAGGRAAGHIQSILEAIRPAVEATRGQDLAATSLANVRHVVDALQHSPPILQAQVAAGSVQVVGANYLLESGVVAFDEAAH
ncbi:MAG: carbonic anhydrase [Opitutales bacterium]|nr:carbonic anhydrase [Opitutales bacterium]